MTKVFCTGYQPDIAYLNDAGIDLRYSGRCSIEIKSNVIYKFKTGLHVEIPIGKCGIVFERSGLGSKYGCTIHGRVIDAPYRGEIIVIVTKFDAEFIFEGDFNENDLPILKTVEPWILNPGDKISQMVVIPHDSAMEFVASLGDLSPSDRGTKGLGSSGK